MNWQNGDRVVVRGGTDMWIVMIEGEHASSIINAAGTAVIAANDTLERYVGKILSPDQFFTSDGKNLPDQVFYAVCARSLRITPAMAAGLSDRVWELSDLVGLLEQQEAALAA